MNAVITKTIQTTCPYCGVGCGIEAHIDEETRQVRIQGDPEHPANFGRLCAKGSALGDTLELSSRLLQPRIHGHESNWGEALGYVAGAFLGTIAKYGPDSIAIYASGQLLTEDYYVANKLMKGFIGSGNIDTNSRLCMSSSVAGHRRAFGADTMPGCYEDYEQAELFVLIGSNAAWCHPVSFQRIRAAKEANPAVKIVVIDPRRTATCDIADLHLALASGTDAVLFNGLLHYLNEQDAIDRAYIDEHTEGFAEALQAAVIDIEQVAVRCRLHPDDVQRFYRWFAGQQKVMSLYSQGVNQSSSGTDKVNAIINCHLATGRIGRPGMGPFSLTGQPNAMGGREVGGLANQLAAHMDFSSETDIERVARFWGSTNIARKPGYSAVELFDAIDEGKVKAVWIMATNPAVSLPDADKVKRALQRCPFVVVSDCMVRTDTAALAHVLLPAQGWSEKDGTVTNSERRISRQRALLNPVGSAKPDWWIITQIARRMGYERAFPYQSAAEIFREHAALSGYENGPEHGRRDFDISALADLEPKVYEALKPIQWPINAEHAQGRARFFEDGQFFTDSGKARFIAITPRAPANLPDQEYPLILNTGRLRDQWHTMTRTALAVRLNQQAPELFVELHPDDASRYGLADKALARLESRWGAMIARVQISDGQLPGNVFVPIHWSEQFAGQGRMGVLVNPALDPVSKQPESKHTPVRIQDWQPLWQGFMLSRSEHTISGPEYWVKTKGRQFYRYELAGKAVPEDGWPDWLRKYLRCAGMPVKWQEFQDTGTGSYRMAQVVNNQLQTVFFVTAGNSQPERGWLSGLFDKPQLEPSEIAALLTGMPPIA